MKQFEIVTAQGEVKRVEADKAVREGRQVSFLVGDEEVAFFEAPSSFSPIAPSTGVAQSEPQE